MFFIAVLLLLMFVPQPRSEKSVNIEKTQQPEKYCFKSKAPAERVTTEYGSVQKVYLKKGFHPLL
ncbi:hypothetical protein D6745_03255 [Candidatus Woesearchaeota archaeon]|nr:MAG: hypothetical protein D6745_03255 [Candidatus Woesearchaeota archaeon]